MLLVSVWRAAVAAETPRRLPSAQRRRQGELSVQLARAAWPSLTLPCTEPLVLDLAAVCSREHHGPPMLSCMHHGKQPCTRACIMESGHVLMRASWTAHAFMHASWQAAMHSCIMSVRALIHAGPTAQAGLALLCLSSLGSASARASCPLCSASPTPAAASRWANLCG